MGVSTLYVLHGVKTASNFYSQIEDTTPEANQQIIQSYGTGFPEPLFTGVVGARPDVTFKTGQLTTAIGELGLFGADLSGGNVDLYYKKLANRGTRVADATTEHVRFRMASAFGYMRSITAGHQSLAKADVRLVPIYDGTNAPVVPAGSLALTGTPTAAENFCLGPITINGSTLYGAQDVTIDFGCQVDESGSDSEPWTSFLSLNEIRPTITIRGLAIEPWTTYGVIGTALTSLTLYLRKVSKEATGGVPYIANGTSAHIKFTATAGLITPINTSGGGNTKVNTGLKITLDAADTSTRSIVMATGQAIS